MLEGVERLVDLTGVRSTALTGASHEELRSALATCDTERLAATDGHLAGTARDGRTVRLARTIGLPLRYFVAKMYHGPFLVVAERMSQIFEWCRAERVAWQFVTE
jgi:asparagine synthase (glutamine-hydrolysing)